MTTLKAPISPLDPQQRAAAEAPVGPVLIHGGPGVGKTHTIVARVGALLKTGAPPREITCITHSDWGAHDMRRRLLQTQEIAEQVKQIRFGTIQQIALEVLRKDGAEVLGLSPTFRVWGRQRAADTIRVLGFRLQNPSEPIFRKMGDGDYHTTENAINNILMWHGLNKARGPEHAVSAPDIWTRIMGAYSEEKHKSRALDLDDLIPMVIRAMETDPQIRAAWQRSRSLHLLVDDYQDITPTKHHFLTLITGPSGSITVAADTNQHIELLRGADCGLLHRFLKDWPQVDIHRLRLNHRQTRTLVQATNSLVDQEHRTGLTLDFQTAARPEDGQRPRLVDCSDHSEAKGARILEWARELLQLGFAWEDMAVICRDPLDVDRMRRELGGVPHTVLGAPGREPDSDTRRVINLMAWALDPLDSEAFSIAAFPESDLEDMMVNRKVTKAIFRAAQSGGMDAVEAAELKVPQFPRHGSIRRYLINLVNARRGLDRMLDDPEVSLHDLCQRAATLVRGGPGEGADPESETDIAALLRLSHALGTIDPDTPRRRLASFLDLLNSDVVPNLRWLENRRQPARPRGIILSTVHASKGMGWKVVFLIDAHGKQLPDNLGFGQQELRDEEDRILFVGFTRASDRLYYLGSLTSGGTSEINARWLWEVLMGPRKWLVDESPDAVEPIRYP